MIQENLEETVERERSKNDKGRCNISREVSYFLPVVLGYLMCLGSIYYGIKSFREVYQIENRVSAMRTESPAKYDQYQEYCNPYDITRAFEGANIQLMRTKSIAKMAREQIKQGSTEPLYSKYLDEYFFENNPDEKSLAKFARQRLSQARAPIEQDLSFIERKAGYSLGPTDYGRKGGEGIFLSLIGIAGGMAITKIIRK